MNQISTIPTLRAGQGDLIGAVSGYLLKVLRESVGVTQSQFAQVLNVDTTTIQGWESGRRPLGAIRAVDALRLRVLLVRLGVPAAAVQLLAEANEADYVISLADGYGLGASSVEDHPLGSSVHRRSLTKMITWPFTGVLPTQLRNLPQRPARRGPVADRPVLDVTTRDQFFDHLLIVADAAAARAPLARRQAVFLLGFDRRPETARWLREQHRRTATCGNLADMRTWLAVRSSSVALARAGDLDPLEWFIGNGLAEQPTAVANLNYWAYWLGELQDPCSDDTSVLLADSSSWTGTRVLGHLVGHLDDQAHRELNIHSLWALVLARPTLLQQQTLRRTVAQRVSRTADLRTQSNRARNELANLMHATKLADL